MHINLQYKYVDGGKEKMDEDIHARWKKKKKKKIISQPKVNSILQNKIEPMLEKY